MEQRGPEKGQGDVVRMFPALLVLLWRRWFCPRRMATSQQKSAGQEVAGHFICLDAVMTHLLAIFFMGL